MFGCSARSLAILCNETRGGCVDVWRQDERRGDDDESLTNDDMMVRWHEVERGLWMMVSGIVVWHGALVVQACSVERGASL